MSLPLEDKKCLLDVLEGARAIEAFTTGLTAAEFASNNLVQAAVERKFEIIGEALSRLVRMSSPVLESITDHARIIGFRNVIAHGYDAVDHAIVWDVVSNYLPQLRREVEGLLGA